MLYIVDEGKTTILYEEINHEHPPLKNLKRNIISNQVKEECDGRFNGKPVENNK